MQRLSYQLMSTSTLQENNYFEEAFKAYEKGIALFKWPYVYDIWNTYLTKFLQRYQGTKIERARDLFEQVRRRKTDLLPGCHLVSGTCSCMN